MSSKTCAPYQFEKLWKMLPVSAYGSLDYREFLKKFSGEIQDQEKSGVSPNPAHLVHTKGSAVLSQRPKTASCIPDWNKVLYTFLAPFNINDNL